MPGVLAISAAAEAKGNRTSFFVIWWLVPLLTLSVVLGLAMLSAVVTSLHSFRAGIIVYNRMTLENYARFILDAYYLKVLRVTTVVGIVVVLLTLILGYTPAYLIARAHVGKGMLIALTVSPIFIPSVVRAFSWTYMLSANGLVNAVLQSVGLIHEPIPLIYNQIGTIIGLTHVLLPFMILSLLSSLQQIDPNMEEAAEGLGASRWAVFRRVLLPLSLPGIVAGSLLVFTLTVASYITPAILGSPKDPLIAQTIFGVFYDAGNWPFGTAISLVVLVYALLVTVLYLRLVQSHFSGASA